MEVLIKRLLILLIFVSETIQGQEFWREGWFVQFGADGSLQNPYGHNFSDAFSEGRSLGVDVAFGKWFTPEVGVRAKLNWENGITKSDGDWLAPFYIPGENHRKGGYVTFSGDVLFNVKNIFESSNSQDFTNVRWQPYVFLRAGGAYNFGVAKGTPMLGLGFGTTYRVNNRWALYGDMAYNGVSSGFVGVEKNTGTGSNSNGFFDVNFGVQMLLQKSGRSEVRNYRKVLSKNGWFVQGALDMSLVNAYGKNFAEVLPKGKTLGVTLATGKWLSNEIGLRVRAKMNNNIAKNSHLEWIGPIERGKSTNDGWGAISADVMLDVKGVLGRKTERQLSAEEQKWLPYVFARAGLLSNFTTESGSPMVGAGIGTTYRLSDRLAVVCDVAYQVSTSEFYDAGTTTGMSVSKGSNGFFDVNLGVQYAF